MKIKLFLMLLTLSTMLFCAHAQASVADDFEDFRGTPAKGGNLEPRIRKTVIGNCEVVCRQPGATDATVCDMDSSTTTCKYWSERPREVFIA